MIKLCIDNTSKLHEFHLYEPYLYGIMRNKNCFLVNDFSKDNSDINNFDITISDAENILLDHVGENYEVTIVTELLENDKPLPRKLYEIDKYISKRFFNSKIQRAKNVTIVILDYTGNSYVDFSKDTYVTSELNSSFFSKFELAECERTFKINKDREEFVNKLKEIRTSKDVNNENEWYFYIFDKMTEHFYDNKLFTLDNEQKDCFADIFSKIMSYYIKKDLVDNKLILRCDMFAKLDYIASLERSFIDMNKLIALLTFDMSDLLTKSKSTLLKGIFDVNIGLDDEKIRNMIIQYSENLKSQLQYLMADKKNTMKVEKRIMPNISLRNIFLEPVKIKNEKLTFFKSGRDIQYLDRIEKYTINSINKRYMRIKRNNIQNICDLRTLRYNEDRNIEEERLTLIELRDKITDKVREYNEKEFETYNNKMDYYEILKEFLLKQKEEKKHIFALMDKKIKAQNFLPYNFIFWVLISGFAIISAPNVVQEISNKNTLYMTIGYLGIINILTSIFIMFLENMKINKQIDKYLDMVNEYNSKLQIGSDEEITKLSRTYELILLNSDIEYYEKKYKELFNSISKYEFHIAQVEKHINIAKRLCDRIGIEFDKIIIANDTVHDEIVADVDINKDVYDNECYDIMHFLFSNKDYCLMLNSGEILEQLSIKTYIKSINFVENEVYKF